MGRSYCHTHDREFNDDCRCPECAEEESADKEAWDAEQRAKASLELQQRRDAEEGVCDCCGQRFVERTRVRQAGHKPWTGVLARHTAAGVCPACANKYGAF